MPPNNSSSSSYSDSSSSEDKPKKRTNSSNNKYDSDSLHCDQFVITQVVKKPVRKGPYALRLSLDPNAVIIQRRQGEGSKPIFDRPDVRVNLSPKAKSISPPPPSAQLRNEPSSPGYLKRTLNSPKKKLSPEKKPYYSDLITEKNRLRNQFREENHYKKRSVSPYKNRSISPYRKRSVSPYKKKSVSPYKKKSISPRLSPERNKGKLFSPKRKRTPERAPYHHNYRTRNIGQVRTKFHGSNSYRKRSISPHLSLERNKRKSLSPKHKRTPEKVPYFNDPIREQERIRAKRKYVAPVSLVRPIRQRSRSRKRSRSPIDRNYRRRKSRSRSNSYYDVSTTSSSHRHRRSSSRNRHKRRRSRSRSRSHSASRSRLRRAPSHENQSQPQPQFIPVPTIPIPIEYAAPPPPGRWMPAPMYGRPRFPMMMPRPPMYPHPHVMPYYPELGPPMPPAPPPRFRGRPPPRFMINLNKRF